MIAAAPSARPVPWPDLRGDLVSGEAGFDRSGACIAVLADPVQGSYVKLSPTASRIVANWQKSDAAAIAAAAAVSTDEVQDVRGFLAQARFTRALPGQWREIAGAHQKAERGLFSKAVHNYLFLRIPLFNPEPLLDALLPLARLLARLPAILLIVLLGIVGAYFTMRQWDVFLAAARDSMGHQGLVAYGVTLIILKFFHELGHGLVARNYGSRVPVIGVALMLLAPMFYTDTTDSWRVAVPRQRLAVASAGILVEMAIACLALFLWSFLPEGDLRSICFFVAVTALVLSLVVNLSPFMRFDGYHMLSDALAMPGLGPRAFALGNWHLRRLFFATREPPPEVFASQWSMGLAVFAWMTWAYRLSLFAGIAWLIYVTLPKAVGFPLAVIEVWFFILRPVLAALRQWFSAPLRAGFGVARSLSSLAVALILGVLALLPLDRHIHVPAILSAREQAWIYPSEAARLTRLMAHPGDQVNGGQLLAELHSPELESLQEQAAIRAGLLAERLRQIASGAKGAETARSLQEELAAVTRELDGLKARKALLAIHAPFTGVLAATGQSPVSGQWLGREDLLFHLRGPEATTVTGLLPERFEGRLFAGAPVVFVAEDGATAPVMGRLEALGMRGGEGLAADYLSTINGGPLLAERDPVTGQTLPLGGHLPFLANMQGAAPGRVLRGTAIITAEPQSLAYMAFGRIATVVLRESGF